MTPEERVAAAKAAAERVSAKLPNQQPIQPMVDPKAQAIEEKRKLLWSKKKEVCVRMGGVSVLDLHILVVVLVCVNLLWKFLCTVKPSNHET